MLQFLRFFVVFSYLSRLSSYTGPLSGLVRGGIEELMEKLKKSPPHQDFNSHQIFASHGYCFLELSNAWACLESPLLSFVNNHDLCREQLANGKMKIKTNKSRINSTQQHLKVLAWFNNHDSLRKEISDPIFFYVVLGTSVIAMPIISMLVSMSSSERIK